MQQQGQHQNLQQHDQQQPSELYKKVYDEIDASPDCTSSEINNHKTRKIETIAPIIYFKLDNKYIQNRQLLEEEILFCTRKENIDIKNLKITANGNLLIFS